MSWMILAVVFAALGIIVDIALHRLRRTEFEALRPITMPLQRMLRRITARLTRMNRMEAPRTDEATTRTAIPVADEPRLNTNVADAHSEHMPVEVQCTPTQNSATVVVRAEVPAGAQMRVTVSSIREGDEIVTRHTVDWAPLASTAAAASARPSATTIDSSSPTHAGNRQRILAAAAAAARSLRRFNMPRVAFAVALGIYLCTVLIGITRYPIFFFTDEAVHSNFAAALLADGLRSKDGTLLPTYFQIDPSFGINGLSVYWQLLPTALFGQSVLVTRTTAALGTLIAAIAVSLMLRHPLRLRLWPIGALLLAASPSWFLHARTAFEYMLVASFYALTLYAYQRYRDGSRRWLYVAVFAAALTFYSHGLGQVLVAATTIAFAASDLRHHLARPQRRTLAGALVLVIILALPWLRFQLNQEKSVVQEQIKQRGSYLMNPDLTLADKAGQWLSEYTYGLSPQFWFLPNDRDLRRHTMPDTGGLPLAAAPFALIGILVCIRRFRTSAAHRGVLLALLTAPIPATLAAIGTPRTLWMIVPWVLLIAIGIETVIEFVRSRTTRFGPWLAPATYVALAAAPLILLAHAMISGPTWHDNYGLYGEQFGAQQVFGNTVAPTLGADPTSRFVVSPSWANGTDQFIAFFIPKEDRPRVSMGQPVDWIDRRDQITPNTYFVATREEFDKLAVDPMFANLDVRRVISYPNDAPGFYVLSLQLSADAEQRIAAEHAARRTPVNSSFEYRGKTATAVHSPLGEGSVDRLFDGNPDSLVRGLEANPLLIDVTLPEATTAAAFDIQTGSMQRFSVTVRCYPVDGTEPVEVTRRFVDLGPDPLITIDLPQTMQFSRFSIEVLDENAQDSAQIHVRDITLR
jgi:hypothetical protein